jgi:hypothetical protein
LCRYSASFIQRPNLREIITERFQPESERGVGGVVGSSKVIQVADPDRCKPGVRMGRLA